MKRQVSLTNFFSVKKVRAVRGGDTEALPTGCSTVYRKWTLKLFASEVPAGKEAKDLRQFLQQQAALRGFSGKQNQRNDWLAKLCRHYDAILTEDNGRAEADRKSLEKLRSIAQKKTDDGEDPPPLEDDPDATPEAPAAPAPTHVSAPPHDIAGIAALMAEADEEYDEEEARERVLEAAHHIRQRPTGVRFSREQWATPSAYPTILEHELLAYAPTQSPQQPTALSFPTELEKSIIPAAYATDEVLLRAFEAHPWLQPCIEGLRCRCCGDLDGHQQRKKLFVTDVLPWDQMRGRLTTKAKDHALNDSGKRHRTNWSDWMEGRRREAALPSAGEAVVFRLEEAAVQKWAKKIQNTHAFVRITTYIISAAQNNRPLHADVTRRFHEEAAFDPLLRKFLQGPFNMTSPDSINTVLCTIAAVTRANVARKLRAARYLSILSDEARDNARKAMYAVLFQFVTASGAQGEVFWDIRSLTGESTARGIRQHIGEMTSPIADVRGKLVGVALDGASVMSGRKRGLHMLLKAQWSPYMFYIWCQCHRLNLICLSAANSFPSIVSSLSLITKVYSFFRKGHQKSKYEAYKQAVEAAASIASFSFWLELELQEPGDTRWLSHERAAVTLVRVLKGVYLATWAIEADSEELRLLLKTDDAVFGLFLLAEAVPHLSRLSKALQKSQRFFSQTFPLRDVCLQRLRHLRDSPASSPMYWNAEVVINQARDGVEGLNPVSHNNIIEFHERVGKPYLNSLCTQLVDGLGMTPELEAFSVFDPEDETFKHPDRNTKGVEKLQTLLNHYTTPKLFKECGPDGEDVEATIPFLGPERVAAACEELPRLYSRMSQKNWDTIGAVVNGVLEDPLTVSEFPESANLLSIAAALPVGTSSVERTFSKLNLVKTKIRRTLHDDTTSNIMLVAFEAEHSNTDGVPVADMEAYLREYSSSDRRLEFDWAEYRRVTDDIRTLRQYMCSHRDILRRTLQRAREEAAQ
eukprot:TRINITY_DN1332_c2_g1_i11.p1 TRINITY_DN1332_c2_g1~~TRINITY_DN1332_c2_g1_i11.p1  ORF type:complete len:978 (-),score=164.62 TRINITY_DN1332_c2_g1_i11:63-2996(-)